MTNSLHCQFLVYLVDHQSGLWSDQPDILKNSYLLENSEYITETCTGCTCSGTVTNSLHCQFLVYLVDHQSGLWSDQPDILKDSYLLKNSEYITETCTGCTCSGTMTNSLQC